MQEPTTKGRNHDYAEKYGGIPRSHIPFYTDRDIYRAFFAGRRVSRFVIAWRVLRGRDYEARWNADVEKRRAEGR